MRSPVRPSTQRNTFRLGLVLLGALALVSPWFLTEGNASTAGATLQVAGAAPGDIANEGFSTETTCAPSISWNPDAGQGLVRCASGYSAVNVECESATNPVYFAHRTDGNGGKLTRTNYLTRGMKRCTTCQGGIGYRNAVNKSQRDLFCIYTNTTDAGLQCAVECAK